MKRKLTGKQQVILKRLRQLQGDLTEYAHYRVQSLGCPDLGTLSRLSNIHIAIEDIGERISELEQ